MSEHEQTHALCGSLEDLHIDLVHVTDEMEKTRKALQRLVTAVEDAVCVLAKGAQPTPTEAPQ